MVVHRSSRDRVIVQHPILQERFNITSFSLIQGISTAHNGNERDVGKRG